LRILTEDVLPGPHSIVARNLARCLQFCQGQ